MWIRLLFVVFLSVGAISQVFAGDQSGTSDTALIAQTMREIQARLMFISPSSGGYQWPSCVNGQVAPPFPSDEFYSSESDDPSRSVVLVQSVLSAFRGLNSGLFRKDSPEGLTYTSLPGTYKASDFVSDSTVVDSNNYKNILQQCATGTRKMQTVYRFGTSRAGSVTYGDSSYNGPHAFLTEAAAQSFALSQLSQNTASSGRSTDLGAGSLTYYSYAACHAETGHTWSDFEFDLSGPRLKSGNATIFLAASGSGNPSTRPVVADGKYHSWTTTNTIGTFVSQKIGESLEPFVSNGGIWNSWWVDGSEGAIAVLKCDFDTTPDAGVSCCGSCSTATCTAGALTTSLNSVHVQMGAGKVGKDYGAAYLLIDGATMTPQLSQFAGLSIVIPSVSGVQKLTSNSNNWQVITKDTLVDLVKVTDFQYKANFYYISAKGASISNGVYPIVAGSTPFKVVQIENPDASTTVYNRLKITENPGTGEKVSLYTCTTTGGVETWTLSTGNDFKIESFASSWNNDLTIRTEVRTVSQGGTPNVVLSKTTSTYQEYPWGEEKIQEIGDPDGNPMTSSWSFYENTTDNGYGRIKQWVDGTGYWERYEYDSNGLLSKTVKQYLGAGVNATDAQSEVETMAPSGTGTVTVRSVQGTEVGRTYVSFPTSTTRKDEICTTPGAASGDAANLVTLTTYTDSTRSKVKSILRPDGTATIYSYAHDSGTNTDTVTTAEGAPDSSTTTITSGTSTVTTYNSYGYVISTVTSEIGVATPIRSESGSNFDSYGRAETWTYNDGTTRLVHYGCCGLETETDRDGISTDYTYDALGNPDTETRAGLTLDYDYDALGRLRKTTRIGSPTGVGSISAVIQGANYDVAGRQTSSTDLLGTTGVSEVYANGMKTRTETQPSGATRIEVTSTDGKAISIGGTSTHRVSYQYGTSSGGLESVTETQSTGPWVTRYTDMAGRLKKVEYPGSAAENLFYNSLGQLDHRTDPDGVSTSYGYNTKGEQETVTVGDRVTKTVRDISTHSGETALRTTVSETGDVVVSVDEESVSSRTQWHTEYGQLTTTVTSGGGASLVKTTTAPDGSQSVETYNKGLLTQRSAPSGTTSYGYDGNNRLWTETDLRTGRVTTYGYDANERINSIVVNGGSAGTLTTGHVFTYELGGLVDTATLPGGSSVRKYFPSGELKSTSGTAEYPVSYTYDGRGQMKTMTTATGTTGWTYSSTRGWLDSKSAVKYTYYPSGRLHTRKGARGIVTTYEYYPTNGDLWKVTYSDGTPSTEITYDNRGRQQTLQDAAGLHTYSYWPSGGVSTRLVSADTITGVGTLSGTTISNSYDSKLRRDTFTASRPGTLVSYSDGYDGASRLQTVTANLGLGLTATYAYLPNSSLVDTVTLKQGGATRVTLDKDFDGFDRQNFSSTIPTSGAAVSYSYHYNTAGRRDTATLADSSYWSYGYDGIGQVTSGGKKWNGGTDVLGQQYGYNYDGIGNRTSTTVNTRSATYTPSPNYLNQYVSRTVPSYVDVLGEIDPAVSALTVNGLTPSRQNSLAYFRQELNLTSPSNSTSPVYLTTTVSATSGSNTSTVQGKIFVPQTPESFGYDPDGNLLSDGRWKYTWDGENRLISMKSQSSAVTAGVLNQRIDFTYDAQGRRLSKTVRTWNGTGYVENYTLLFLYDGWNLAAEVYKQTGNAVRTYIWGADMSGGQAAGGIGGLLFIRQAPENKSFSVGYDGNGNVTALHDMADASLAARYEYGPFGELIRASGYYAPVNPIRWSTRYQDAESKLVYYGYRYYNPGTGRWISRDPIGEQGGVNLYAFLNNAPLSKVDALGLMAKLPSPEGSYILRNIASVPYDPIQGGLAGAPGEASGFEVEYKPADTCHCKNQNIKLVQAAKIGWWAKPGIDYLGDRPPPDQLHNNPPGYTESGGRQGNHGPLSYIDAPWANDTFYTTVWYFETCALCKDGTNLGCVTFSWNNATRMLPNVNSEIPAASPSSLWKSAVSRYQAASGIKP
jgi:RHS repeat-associated protein